MDRCSQALLLALSIPVAYLYVLALAAIRRRLVIVSQAPRARFAIVIPAHNEAGVIGATVATALKLDYPQSLFDVHVVADHCTDATAKVAQTAGARAHERHDGPRGGKGAALSWIFERILHEPSPPRPNGAYDAVVVIDADTQMDSAFLRVMDARLSLGDQVIQGQHRISNPQDGWLPAMVWAMFMVDNRFQNLGRSNLGWSAKHMGDSICFRADVLRCLGWGEGLTEDYALRQQLLLEGITIRYEPDAVGRGEAPTSWRTAQGQRARWLRGTHDASQRYRYLLLKEGLRRRDPAILDGAMQAFAPSFSSLTLSVASVGLVRTLASFVFARAGKQPLSMRPSAWTVMLGALICYPFLGLIIDRAPFRAYQAMILGPAFIVWRTWLAIVSRRRHSAVTWIRTPRRPQ